MSSSKKIVLVTGAGGRVGRMFAKYYAERYQLRLMDRRETAEVPDGAETIVANITDAEAVGKAMDGVDTVVHLAGDPAPWAQWESALANNISGLHCVFDAAKAAGVRRVVYASSSHACAEHIREFDVVGPDAPVRPDTIYGVTKVFGEALGRFYSDRHGLSVVCLRIGWCLGFPDIEAQRQALQHMLNQERPRPYKPWQNIGIWISNRDVAQLIHRSIEADVQFGIFYGASDNDPAVFDLSETKRQLGYAPEDSAQAMIGEAYGPDLEAKEML
jgi:NAD+ dependent glucose-6-phosphate dehydrogenase